MNKRNNFYIRIYETIAFFTIIISFIAGITNSFRILHLIKVIFPFVACFCIVLSILNHEEYKDTLNHEEGGD